MRLVRSRSFVLTTSIHRRILKKRRERRVRRKGRVSSGLRLFVRPGGTFEAIAISRDRSFVLRQSRNSRHPPPITSICYPRVLLFSACCQVHLLLRFFTGFSIVSESPRVRARMCGLSGRTEIRIDNLRRAHRARRNRNITNEYRRGRETGREGSGRTSEDKRRSQNMSIARLR